MWRDLSHLAEPTGDRFPRHDGGLPGSELSGRRLRRSSLAPVLVASGARSPLSTRRGEDTPRATTCTYHCGACHRHFHSLAAFDVHRVGDFASNDPETRRRCQSPLDALDGTGEMRLVLLTDKGVCRAYELADEPVMVWTMSGSLERARERWGLRDGADV